MTTKPIIKPRENIPANMPLPNPNDYSELLVRIRASLALLEASGGIYERLVVWAERVLLRDKPQEWVDRVANPMVPAKQRWRKLRHFLPPKALETLATKLEQECNQ